MHRGWLFCSILSVNSHVTTTHITQGYFTGIVSFAWLPYYQHSISAISVRSTDIKSQHCAVVNNAHGWYFVLYWHRIGQHIIMWYQELQTVWNIITHILHSNSMIGSLIFSLIEYFNAHTQVKVGFASLFTVHIIARWLYTSLSLLCRAIWRHELLKCLSSIFCLECMSKPRSVLSIIFHAIYGAVCIQLIHFSYNRKCDPFAIV